MRTRRFTLLLLAIYLVFVGGSAYYSLFFPVRVLHHAVITVVLALWLLGRLRRGQGLPLTPINRPLYAAVSVWAVSAAFSIDPRMAVEHLWFPLTHGLFFFALADMIQRGRQRQLMEIQFFLGALVVIVTGLELASWYFGLGIVPGTSVGWVDVIGPGLWLPLDLRRVSLAMNISTLLAGYVAPLVVLAAGWALTAERRYRGALWGLAAALALVLALTMSRGGYLSAAAGLGTLFVLRATASARVTRLLSKRTLLLAGVLAVLALGVGFVVVTTSPGRAGGDLGRLDMWQSAVRLAAAHPLTGVGPGLFGPAFRAVRDPLIVQDKLASAHNVYLNTAAETGVFGVVVALWLAWAFGRAWWRQRQAAEGGRQFRLDVCFAALVGLGIHSLADVFTITPIVLLIALLAAYCVVRPRVGFAVPSSDGRLTAVVALALVLAYGTWLGWLDVAQGHYQASLRGGEQALDEARQAAALDPGLRLYALQVAYVGAQQAEPTEARRLYADALALDPTWDTGWINLAALAEQDGDISAALDALSRARALNEGSPATLNWARIADAHETAPRDAIVEAYRRGMGLPLSSWWLETEARREAVEGWLADTTLDLRYRVLMAHDPARAAALVPSEPVTVEEWWVVGQAAYESGDRTGAEAAFTQAIVLAPRLGDLYVSRAHSRVDSDPEGARRDLTIAELVGTWLEYPNAVRAELTDDLDEQRGYWAAALPPRAVGQEYAAVMYVRQAGFDIAPLMRPVGPGSAALAPWYALAQSYEATGELDAAANVYRAIVEIAPEEDAARAAE